MKYNNVISTFSSKWKQCVRDCKLIWCIALVDGEVALHFGNGYKMFCLLNVKIRPHCEKCVCIRYKRPTALCKWVEMRYVVFHWSILFKISYKVVCAIDEHHLQHEIINTVISKPIHTTCYTSQNEARLACYQRLSCITVLLYSDSRSLMCVL